jgi:hypothetical protein
MLQVRRFVMLALSAAILAACGKSENGASDLPLSFAPADTPYAYANLEPSTKEMLAQSSRQMQAVWPTVFGLYDNMLKRAHGLDDREKKIAAAILDELRNHDTLDKLRELGLKPDGHVAVYGVGLIPVLRMELGDPATFKATIARVEAKVGEKIATGKTGNQDYWQIGDGKISAIFAVQNSHFVATLWANEVNDTVKQALLGVTKPAKNLAEAGTLPAIAKQYSYTPYGEGYIDAVALVQRLTSAPTGTDLEIAKAMQLPTDGNVTDAVCKAEFLDIAHKFPRIVVGAESVSAQKVQVGFQFEIETTLAQQLMAALTPAPGTAATGQGLFDFSLSLPVLKFKDFWIKQANAVAAKPFACASLAKLNDEFAESKARIDTTIPPPFSDLTGMRITVTKVEPRGTGAIPDVAGKVLMGSSNPLGALGMAQLALPQLKDLKIAADGKPVALPPNLVPAQVPPLSVALSDKAIAIAAGAGEEATLSAYLAATPASTPVFMRSYATGAIYGVMARYFDVLKQSMPADKRDDFAEQTKMFAIYEKMLKSIQFTFEANANGIALHETVEMNPLD